MRALYRPLPVNTCRHSTEDQGFPLCAEPSGPGPSGCDNITASELIYYPMLMYLVWQTGYILVVQREIS